MHSSLHNLCSYSAQLVLVIQLLFILIHVDNGMRNECIINGIYAISITITAVSLTMRQAHISRLSHSIPCLSSVWWCINGSKRSFLLIDGPKTTFLPLFPYTFLWSVGRFYKQASTLLDNNLVGGKGRK